MNKSFPRGCCSAFTVVALLSLSACSDDSKTASSRYSESFLIECSVSCAETQRDIARLGGKITIRYQNIPALAVSLPENTATKAERLASVKMMTKDLLVNNPRPVTREKIDHNTPTQIDKGKVQGLTDATIRQPTNYLLNSALTGAGTLHEAGELGADVIVAIIDSGVANNADVVHVLQDTVIGGENLVPGAEEPSATSTLNDPHGTMVASMIAAHGGFIMGPDSLIAAAVKMYAPDSILELETGEFLLPMIGTAPASKVYALKVFPAANEGAPSSRVLFAMDRVVTLKKNYLDGVSTDPIAGDGSEDNPFEYEALNIQVVNLSLGGPALFPGFELDDLLTLQMLAADITVVTSAGNDGPAALTVGSPAGGYGALSVGAASSPVHERILRELQYGPTATASPQGAAALSDSGVTRQNLASTDRTSNGDPGAGKVFRPTEHMQTAYFSSRGPLADGRIGIDVMANGVACYVQGANGDLFLVSGTSFSAPTVAGAAALLRGAAREANAVDIRQALLDSANPELIGAMPMAIDQGRGFIDIVAANDLLQDDDLEARLPRLPEIGNPKPVIEAVKESGQNIIEMEDGSYSTHVSLMPGQVKQLYVPISMNTGQLDIDIGAIMPALAPEEQNAMFGDDLIVTIVDAPFSYGEFLFDDFIFDDTNIQIAFPQTGLLRVAIMGDWTNAGLVDADVMVSISSMDRMRPSARGRIEDEEEDLFEFDIPEGTNQLNFKLAWARNWSYSPTHDLDIEVYDPNGDAYFDGATLRSPEMFSVSPVVSGTWTVKVVGFMLHGFADSYALYVSQEDGSLLQTSSRRFREND